MTSIMQPLKNVLLRAVDIASFVQQEWNSFLIHFVLLRKVL